MVTSRPGPPIRRRIQRVDQVLHYPFPVPENVLVSVSHRSKTKFLPHPSVPDIVPIPFMGMPINLNHQAFLGTEEINDPIADHSLPAKLERGKAPVAKFIPKATLGLGRIVAHRLGASEQHFSRHATTPNPLL